MRSYKAIIHKLRRYFEYSVRQFCCYVIGPFATKMFFIRLKSYNETNVKSKLDGLLLEASFNWTNGVQPKRDLIKIYGSSKERQSPEVRKLIDEGFAKLPTVDENTINEVAKHLDSLPAVNRDGISLKDAILSEQYEAPTFWYDVENLNHETIDRLRVQLCCDEFAKEYFGDEYVFGGVSSWVTLPSKDADNLSAQMYHYDLDGGWFIKFFCYITDVDMNNGPFVFVKNTHFQKSKEVITGRRLSDKVIDKLYSNEVHTSLGTSGTSFVADTQALHKGSNVIDGSRKLVQFLYLKSEFART